MATMATMATPILKLEKMKCEWVEGGVINNQRIPRRFFFQRLARGGGHGGHGGHGQPSSGFSQNWLAHRR